MMTREEIIADSQEHRGGLMEVSNALYAVCAEHDIEIPITEGGDAEQVGINFGLAIIALGRRIEDASDQ